MTEHPQILIPDLSHTEWLNLIEVKLRGEIRTAEFILKGIEEGQSDFPKEDCLTILNNAKKSLEEYRPGDDSPTIAIGYIPPRKLSSLNARFWQSVSKLDKEKNDIALAEKNTELVREFVRWGVKDHKGLKVPYAKDSEQVGPMTYPVTAWEMVDIYEAAGLLNQIFHEVVMFNRLGESKKKQSSSLSGTTQTNSTASSASSSHP